jgi:hypothetical protein
MEHNSLFFVVLVKIESQAGFLPVVLQIFSSEQLELGARQAGNEQGLMTLM